MTIAVDPRVIPLGSDVLIVFQDEDYQKYNGVYHARDVGGKIKGSKIDMFLGDFRRSRSAVATDNFGVVKAKVFVIRNHS